MMEKKFNILRNDLEKQPNKVFHSRGLRKKAHNSLFKSCVKNGQNKSQKVAVRYFNHMQVQRLAKFLALPAIQENSVDTLLACHLIDTHKAKLQKILTAFVNEEIGAVSTVRNLERFVHENKPLGWQLWRYFEFLRFQALSLFIEDFKCNCFKEILQGIDGYREAPNLYETRQHLVNQTTKASNIETAPKSYVTIAKSVGDKQQRSLFLRNIDASLAQKSICHSANGQEASAQTDSFFKTFN